MNVRLASAVAAVPVVDIHSHIDRNRMHADGLDMILFYHMLRYPMMASGFEKDLLWKWTEISPEDKARRFARWLELWPTVENTSFAWILKRFLKDLYGFNGPLDIRNFGRLERLVAEQATGNGFVREVMKKARIELILTSKFHGLNPLAPGDWDGNLLYTNERGIGGGPHEYRSWDERFKGMEEKSGRTIATLSDLRTVLENHLGQFEWSDKHAYVAWVSSTADFKPAADAVVDGLIARARSTGPLEQSDSDRLEGAFIRATCEALKGRTRVFQLVYGCQFVTGGHRHPEQRARWDYAGGLGFLCGDFPDLHFNILNGFEPQEPELCSLALAYDNLSLGGFWWHTFYPSVMKAAWHRRLEMVPVSRLQGFFSDGYCIDWVYGRLALTRKVLGEVLSEKVRQGYYTFGQAVRVAEDVLNVQPKRLFGIR